MEGSSPEEKIRHLSAPCQKFPPVPSRRRKNPISNPSGYEAEAFPLRLPFPKFHRRDDLRTLKNPQSIMIHFHPFG
jgi:hypothetical protein